MEFAHPYYLLGLVGMPFLFFWYLKNGRHKEASIRYSNIEFIPNVAIQRGERRALGLILTKLIIITLMLFALARPRISDTILETNVEVVDILLVIDQSSSMLAQDFKPNRLEAAKVVAQSFIKAREGDRLGLIVFAGESYIQCPITRDVDILTDFTRQIEIVDKEHDGTAIGMAIATAINRLRDSDAASRVAILLSDGSNNAGELDPITAAELANTFGIRFYTVAAGTHGMAPYPVTDIFGRKTIQNIQVDVDETTLKEIATITGGKFFRATDNESLQQVYSEINKLERTEIEVMEYQNFAELYSWFTIPAALLSLTFLFSTRGIFAKFL